MTRDEAIKVLTKHHTGVGDYWAGPWIDSFAALGLLKLDEPNSYRLPSDQIKARVRNMATNYASQASIFDWIDRLDIAGLKLVEK